MQIYKIDKLKINNFKISNEKLLIPEIDKIKSELSETKSLQDKYYLDQIFLKIVNLYDPFKKEKHNITNSKGTQNVTNAWIKCFELLNNFDLINNKNIDDETFIYFDNASFPGSFILAVNHYINSDNILNKDFKWYASSYLSDKGNILNDSFNLYKNYKSNWLMDKDHNGDVRDINNILFWESKFKNKVNLYTSDLGFEVSDYNNQEIDHIHANYGQIYTGLVVLKNGGNFVTKQYTFFEDLSINIIGILTILFEEIFITKPIASKSPNSEIYIIGKSYKGPWESDSKEQELLNLIKNKIINFNLTPIISINPECDYIISMKKTLNLIYNKQIKSIKDRIQWYNKIKNSKDIKKEGYNLLKLQHQQILNEWYKKNNIKKNNKTLNIKFIY